jgi:hypothetical protein
MVEGLLNTLYNNNDYVSRKSFKQGVFLYMLINNIYKGDLLMTNNTNEFVPFTKQEADKFAFYTIPKELTTNPKYKNISNDAKFLYGILRDRNQLSLKNNWIDKNGNVFIYFTREEAGEILNFASEKVGKIFKELHRVNLIQEKRQGLGKANLIFVGKIMPESTDNTKTPLNRISRQPAIEIQEPSNSNGSNTDFNNNKNNKEITTTILPLSEIEVKEIVNKVVVAQSSTPCMPPKKQEQIKDPVKDLEPIKQQEQTKVKELQDKILDKIKVHLSPWSIKIMLTKGIEHIEHYIDNWNSFLYLNINNAARFFECAVMNSYAIPQAIVREPNRRYYQNNNNKYYNNKPNSNFDQRTYSDEFYDSLYANMPECPDSRKYLTEVENC